MDGNKLNGKIIIILILSIIIIAAAGFFLLSGYGSDEPSPNPSAPALGNTVALDDSVWGEELNVMYVGYSQDNFTSLEEAIPNGSGQYVYRFNDSIDEIFVKIIFTEGTYYGKIIPYGEDGFILKAETKTPEGTPISKPLIKDTILDVYISLNPNYMEYLNWTQWGGNPLYFGIGDSLTPTEKGAMKEVWNVKAQIDASSMSWKTPGSAICVDENTYYWDGKTNSLYRVETSSGKVLDTVDCPSKSVYNMALAYGDGKIFVPCNTGSATVVRAYDADTLNQLYVSEPVRGGEVQGPISYYDGYIFFGTYGGDFACISTEDINTSKKDETAKTNWILESKGWYNASPAFFGDHCVLTEVGWYTDVGAKAYCINYETGSIDDVISFDQQYCTSGVTGYEGRAYIAFNAVVEEEYASKDNNNGKSLRIRSFEISEEGKFVRNTEKVWTSETGMGTDANGSPKSGGTQSSPVIWNDRLYIAGGGHTMGTSEPFTVLDIAENGDMSLAYKADGILSKCIPIITTGYAEDKKPVVYIYMIEYGKVFQGESADSTKGSADIFVLSDSKGQTSPKIEFRFTPSVQQFAYQSFTISPDGYVLVRNDSTLFCYGTGSDYEADDVVSAINRILDLSEKKSLSAIEVYKVEARYALLDSDQKSEVTNYKDLHDIYCNVVFEMKDAKYSLDVPYGSSIPLTPDIVEGMFISGWKHGSEDWNISSDKVVLDMVLNPIYSDSFKVSFDSAGGSETSSLNVAENSNLGYVKDPVKSGYTFGGWFVGDKEYEPMYSEVKSDLTLKAKWLKNSTISFDSDGGSKAQSIDVTYGEPVGELPKVLKTGFAFGGWFYEGKEFTSETIYNYEKDIVLTAKWNENDSITLSCGNVKVTADMPEGTTMTVKQLTLSGLKSVSTIREYAGDETECYRINLRGDGITSGLEFLTELPVGSAQNDKILKVYVYIPGEKITEISGKVSNGVLKINIPGGSNSSGVDLVFGLDPGTNLSKEVD